MEDKGDSGAKSLKAKERWDADNLWRNWGVCVGGRYAQMHMSVPIQQ